MPDVAEGLGTPEAGEEVNAPGGFEAAIAAKVGRTEELEGREPILSTSIADGLVEAGTAAERDAAGRFKPAAEQEEEGKLAEDEGTTDEGEPEDELSPEVESLLEKHGGDAEAALAEAIQRHKNAESLIGRQGNDLGKLREEIAELRGEVRAQRELAPTAATQEQPPMSNEELEELVAEHGGQQVALWAVNERPDLYERVHRIWRVDEPDEATDFRLEYKLHQQRLELQKAQAPAGVQQDEWVVAQKQQAAINSSLATFASEAADWDTIAPHMTAALEQVPDVIAQMVASEDPQVRLDGISIVADKARILSVGKAQATAKTKELATARKKSATVASGSLRPVSPAAGSEEEITSEERQRRFKEELLKTQTTSVSEGLTFAKQ